jgi:hypothetical protein
VSRSGGKANLSVDLAVCWAFVVPCGKSGASAQAQAKPNSIAIQYLYPQGMFPISLSKVKGISIISIESVKSLLRKRLFFSSGNRVKSKK